MSKKKIIEEKKYLGMIEDYDKFLLPDMGDYMADNMSLEYMGTIGNLLSKNKEDSGLKYAFYAESPFTTNLGYFPDQHAFVVDATPTWKDGDLDFLKNNVVDGDTLRFNAKTAKVGNDSFKIGNRNFNSFAEYVEFATGENKNNKKDFELRLLGIDTAELPHYSPVDSNKKYKTKAVRGEDVKDLDKNYIYEVNKPRGNSDTVVFYEINGKYHEYQQSRNSYVLVDDSPRDRDYYNDAKKAQKLAKEMLDKSIETRIVIDAKTISKNGNYDRNDGFLDILESTNTGSGYNIYGLDAYRRFLGAVYVKVPIEGNSDGEWINLNKYILANTELTEGLAHTDSNGNFLSDAFRIWSYDYKNFKLQDIPGINDLNDVKDIQSMIFGRDYEELYDWTVTIGDNAFIVPPTSIRAISQNSHERVSLLRAKGSMCKSTPKTDRLIEMELYFNEDVGINGYPIKNTSPNGQECTYYMNGLRSLIAMFKFTPFLPIHNRYLNEVLNVDAVSLVSLNISTIPNYPKCISATLVLQEFDYRIYMPDLPIPDPDKGEDLNRNMFAETINYGVMRYYYQRALMKGQALRGVPFNSQEYIVETLGHKSALQPMSFENPNIEFYVVDKDFLDLKKMVKQQADNTTITQLNPLSEKTKLYKKQYLVPVMDNIKEVIYDDNFLNLLAEEANNPSDSFSQKIVENFSGIDLNRVKVRKTAPTILHKNQTFEITFDLNNKNLESLEVREVLQNIAEEAGEAPGYVKSNSITVNFESNKGDQKAKVIPTDFARKMLNIGIFDGGTLPGEFMQDEMREILEDINYENSKSLNFIKYELGDIRVKTLASTSVNSFSQISLQLADGFAPQYVGAQDTAIEIAIETTDEGAVRLINQLSKLASLYLREYREVLNVWPIRINSEITRMMGVAEVVVDNVDVTTVPNFPGLYSITMRLTSVDRTLKNRELAQKIEKEEELSSTTSEGINIRKTKDFFELKEGLAQADVYPDLELPTIDELEELGYNFIKYTARPNMRKYPDPDFYFYYGHVIGSTVFREGIIEFISNNEMGEEFTLSDISGSEITIKPSDDGMAFEVLNVSEDVEHRDNKKAKIEKAKAEMGEKYVENLNLENKTSKDILLSELHDVWNVSNDIKCHFREDSYESYMNGSYKDKIKTKEKSLIDAINKELDKDFIEDYSENEYINFSSHKNFEKSIEKHLKKIFDEGHLKEIITNLYIGGGAGYRLETELSKMIIAIGSARTGFSEYNGSSGDGLTKAASEVLNKNGDKSDSWKARISETNNPHVPYAEVGAIGQDLSPTSLASSIEDALENGVVFGPFGIREYSTTELSVFKRDLKPGKTYFLDPKYNNVSKDKIEKYKKLVMTNEQAAIRAIFREVLVWMKLLLEKEILVSVYDFIQNSFSSKDLAASYGVYSPTGFEADTELDSKTQTEINSINDSIGKIISDNKEALALGQFFSSCILTATEGSSNLLSMILEKDYDGLNGAVQTTAASNSANTHYDEDTAKFRKYIKALVGYGLISSIESIGSIDRDVKQHVESLTNSKLFIQAAEEPYIYLTHSFYDMIVNDKRGRMLRAFPCYYMMFIDEGREIGFWKLHDNFYNMNAISEMQIVKSRKIAADTATITMSNMFQTFDQDDRSIDKDTRYSISDAVDSIFSPYKYARKAELERKMDLAPGKVMLKPGIRIHIRMGYGANASMLPVLFNGSIAEVGNGEVVEIIAQGDGIELTNPLSSTRDAEEEKNKDRFVLSKWFHNLATNGDTPKSILSSLLKKDESFTKKIMKDFSSGLLFNRNPYGIEHFGSEEFNSIFSEGEFVQNIYEAGAKASWGKNTRDKNDHINLYAESDAPRLSFELYGKSYWDIMHICKSAAVDFVTSVVPFQFRSSIFYGAPRYYYAYDYDKVGDAIKEKRKPFQQYHIYTSYSDIIKNNIVASEKDIKTCGYGVFMKKDIVWGSSESTVGPIFVDSDIYPEKQKTMIVNTNLKSKGIPIIGSIPLIGGGASAMMHQSADAEGKATGGKSLASRMVCDALKDSVKDMYKGELIVLGDPSIKPYDKVIISDAYTTINGTVETEAVVHTFSLEEGFVTSVYPDCISTVDDRFERVSQAITTSAVGKSLATYLAIVAPSWIFARNTRPLLTQAFSMAGKGAGGTVENINSLLRLIDKDEISTAKFLNELNKVSSSLGINAYVSSIDSIIGEALRFNKINPLGVDITDAAKISKALNNLDGRVTSINSKSVIDDIDKLIDQTTDQAEKRKLVKYRNEIVNNQNNISSAINSAYTSNISKSDIANAVDVLDDIAKKSTNAQYADEIKAIADGLRGKSSISSAKERELINKAVSNMTNVSDDVASKANSFLKKTSSVHDNVISNAGVKKAVTQLADGDEIKALSKLGSKGKLGAAKSKIATFMGGPVGLAIELVISLVIESAVKSAIERELASLEALKIFPLKKNSRVYTAGLDGSKGIVVGCPSESQQGLVTKYAGKLFGSDDGMFDSVQGFLLGMFASDRMRELGRKYAGSDSFYDSPTAREETSNKLLEHLASQETNKSNAYYSSLFKPRVSTLKTEKGELVPEVKTYFNSNSVDNISNIEKNNKITSNMVPIIAKDNIKRLSEENLLFMSHDVSSKKKPYVFDFSGDKILLNGVKENNMLDLPILEPDTLSLLEIIIQEIAKENDKSGNMYGEDSWFKTHPIIIQSALRVGKKSMSSCGLQFVFSVKNYSNIEAVLNKIQKEQHEIYKIYGRGEFMYFKYSKFGGRDDTYRVEVFPPQM